MRRFVAPGTATAAGPTPSFSVMIAAYQVADLIGEAVESALAQTVPPAEIVVCDDGSADDIVGALAPYRERITLLRKENGGEGSAYNAAARSCSAAFVAILDADDVYEPERLEALGELASSFPALDLLTTDAYLESDGEILRRCYTESFRFVVDDQRTGILEQNFVFGLAAVRRERFLELGGFDESVRWAADWDLFMRMILGGSAAGLVDEPLARYRFRAGSLMSQRVEMERGRLAVLRRGAAHPGLTPGERAAAGRAIQAQRRELALAEAQAALREQRPDARRRSLRVAFGRGQRPVSRLKAVVSAIAPRRAGRRLAEREASSFVGPAGIRVARD